MVACNIGPRKKRQWESHHIYVLNVLSHKANFVITALPTKEAMDVTKVGYVGADVIAGGKEEPCGTPCHHRTLLTFHFEPGLFVEQKRGQYSSCSTCVLR